MFKNILILLFDSESSEWPIRCAKDIVSESKNSEVVLFNVVHPLSINTIAALATAGDKNISRFEDKCLSEAKDHNSKLVQKLIDDGISAKGYVVVGDLFEAMKDYISKSQIDLVIMINHCGLGISKLEIEKIAEKIMRHFPVPILLIPST